MSSLISERQVESNTLADHRSLDIERRSLSITRIVLVGSMFFLTRFTAAAPPFKQFPMIAQAFVPEWAIKKQARERQEQLDQDEQIELSKAWKLDFPQNIQDNELAGVIVDSEGHPIAGALIDLFPAFTGHETTADERGQFRFKFDKFRPGETVEVRYSGDGFSPVYRRKQQLGLKEFVVILNKQFAAGVTEPMETQAGQRIENLNIQLHRPATVRGRVSAADDRKPGGLEVRAHACDKRGNRYFDPTVKTKEDGTFELSFIRPGQHYIQVQPFLLPAEKAQAPSSAIVILEEGETVNDIELQVVEQK